MGRIKGISKYIVELQYVANKHSINTCLITLYEEAMKYQKQMYGTLNPVITGDFKNYFKKYNERQDKALTCVNEVLEDMIEEKR